MLWEVTSEESNADRFPYAVVVPYATCEVAGSVVVHVMIALLVDGAAFTALITGGVPPELLDTVTITEELTVTLPWTSVATAARECVPFVDVVVSH